MNTMNPLVLSIITFIVGLLNLLNGLNDYNDDCLSGHGHSHYNASGNLSLDPYPSMDPNGTTTRI